MREPARHGLRCFCGACDETITAPLLTVAACHCADCRRWTGAALPVFAAFAAAELTEVGKMFHADSGSRRWNCAECGSPLMATFPYLPEQIYIPVGVLDTAEALMPKVQSYKTEALGWIHLDGDVAAFEGSSRDALTPG